MATRQIVNGRDRVISELGITTVVKNKFDNNKYVIGMVQKLDGTWLNGVAKIKLFGLRAGPRIWEITTATSAREALENHMSLEVIVQKAPRGKWEWLFSLPEMRTAVRKDVDVLDAALREKGFPGITG